MVTSRGASTEDLIRIHSLQIYEGCRHNCYENDIFFTCLNATLVPWEIQLKVLNLLASLNGGNIFGLELVSS